MANARALIIACETYPRAEDVARDFAGATLKAAGEFVAWLTAEKKLTAADIYVCSDAPVVAAHPADRSFPATRAGIGEAITELVETHRNFTAELYVFFSGHGIGYEQSTQQQGLDLLLASDYRSRKKSGAACINLGELQAQLEIWLGGEDHYYFIDACRVVFQAGEIQPGSLGLALDPATSGDPTRYALFSVKFGEAAKVNPKFSEALLSGLRGESRAKARIKTAWWVRFDRLQQYVESRVDVRTDSQKIGGRDGLIVKLAKTFETNCKVLVEGAGPADKFELKAAIAGAERSFAFAGGSFESKFPPSDEGYGFTLHHRGRPVRQMAPPDDAFLDLFEPVELRFRMPVAGGGPKAIMERPRPTAPPADGTLEVHPAPPRGEASALTLTLRASLRIIRKEAMFRNLKLGDAGVYVLASLGRSRAAHLSVTAQPAPRWRALRQREGEWALTAKVEPGPQWISLVRPGAPPVTFASYALANRASLFVAAEDRAGRLEIRQMLLPVGGLMQGLPALVADLANKEALELVRYATLQQERFEKRESMQPASDEERKSLDMMLYGKWLDPLLALTALYEMARRGAVAKEVPKMAQALANLESYFGELPDVAAAQRILGRKAKLPAATPMLRESLLRMPEMMKSLPLPAGLLDHGSMWTSWLGAVKGPKA